MQLSFELLGLQSKLGLVLQLGLLSHMQRMVLDMYVDVWVCIGAPYSCWVATAGHQNLRGGNLKQTKTKI